MIQLMYGYSFEKRISLLKCYTMLIQNKWQVYYCGICTYYIINNSHINKVYMCNTYVHVFIKTKILVKVLKKFIVVI